MKIENIPESMANKEISMFYDCTQSCRECPFPGAKCNKNDLGNVKNIVELEENKCQ